jgi:hypothetical protein
VPTGLAKVSIQIQNPACDFEGLKKEYPASLPTNSNDQP